MEELKVETKSIDMSKVEDTLLQEKKVSEEVVEKSLNYDALTEEEKKAIDEFIAKIDPKNTLSENFEILLCAEAPYCNI